MLVVCSNKAVQNKYGQQVGSQVLAAVAALGAGLDASDLTETQIRDMIDEHDANRALPVCLIGGYDLVPTFSLKNPTRHAAKEVDEDVLSDAPYGARPGSDAEKYLPTRAISRLPDSGLADAGAFLALLSRAAAATVTPTPAGTFEQAAAEFDGSAQLVNAALPGQTPPRLSPPDPQGMPAIDQLVSGRGRIHILLHGSDRAPGRSTLWGRAAGSDFSAAATASDLASCTLSGAIVSFSTCYSAMLDSHAGDPPRAPDNQVALACLAAGAKVVYGSTRATWIDITVPFDSFGAALVAKIWEQLRAGKAAAEALRLAKWEYSRTALQSDAWTQPYVLKTLLQAHCYGHPNATL